MPVRRRAARAAAGCEDLQQRSPPSSTISDEMRHCAQSSSEMPFASSASAPAMSARASGGSGFGAQAAAPTAAAPPRDR
jgi:hypothetical protein